MAPTLAISVSVQAEMMSPRVRAASIWLSTRAALGSRKKMAPSAEVSR